MVVHPPKLIHPPNLINVRSELVNHCVRIKNPCLPSKSQNPTEELVADFHLCGDAEVGFVRLSIGYDSQNINLFLYAEHFLRMT